MANDVSSFKIPGDATTYSFNDSDAESAISALQGDVQSAYNEVAGLTVRLSYRPSAPNVMRLRITGQTTSQLNTSQGYANLWNANTFLTAAVGARTAATIKYITMSSYRMQLYVESSGLIKIGYTIKFADDTATNIPSGTSFFINEVLFFD